jgi:hypothetical protein
MREPKIESWSCCAMLRFYMKAGCHLITCENWSGNWLLYMACCRRRNHGLCKGCAETMVRIIIASSWSGVTCQPLLWSLDVAEVYFRKYFHNNDSHPWHIKCVEVPPFIFDNSYDNIYSWPRDCLLGYLKIWHFNHKCYIVEWSGEQIMNNE